MRRGVCGLATGLAVLVAAAPGDAATVSVSGTTVIYQAAPGEVNKPLVDTIGTAVVFGDSVAPTLGAGCAPFGETGAMCSGTGIRSVVVNLGDRDDSMARNVLEGEVPAGARLAVGGGAGKDFIIGTTGRDTLSGGSGDDKVYGSGGRDVLKGGSDKDRLTGFGTLKGGTGNDFIEAFYGFSGDYKPFATEVFAGAGNDRVLTGNKVRDTVDCGSGRKDRASTTDTRGRDKFKSNCESRLGG
jgi:Ca2+-binding RTX toxin-like protein